MYTDIFPFGLNFIYPRWTPDLSSLLTYLPSFLWAGLVVWFILRLREPTTRSAPLALILLVSYFLFLFPVLGFYPVYFMRYSFVADHWQYLSLMSVAAGAAYFVRSLINNSFIFFTISMVLVLGLTTLSYERSVFFADEKTLWTETLARNPSAWLAHNNLAIILRKEGKITEALEHYLASTKIKPSWQAYNNMGLIYFNRGELQLSVVAFEKALELNTFVAEAHSNLGLSLYQLLELDRAQKEIEIALQIEPSASAYCRHGAVMEAKGLLNQAFYDFEKAMQLEPNEVFYKKNMERFKTSHDRSL